MPGIHPSHFPEMLIFALLVSAALACMGRRSFGGRIKYALWSLGIFLVFGIGIAWLMYPFSK